jgi:hypothetical protein
MSVSACAALALGPVSGDEKPAPEPAAQEPAAADVASASVEGAKFNLPPGFKPKKRGKYILYCKTDTPIGSRFKSETCFDDAQMRDYLVWLQENKRDIDRIRATCANLCACGRPDAC